MIPRLIDKLLCLFVFVILTSPIVAQTIENVEVEGNSVFSDSEYKDWINIDKSLSPSLTDTIFSRVSYNLKQNGFYNFSIDSINTSLSPDSQNISIKLFLEEGEQTTINDIFISNLDSLETAIANKEFYLLI